MGRAVANVHAAAPAVDGDVDDEVCAVCTNRIGDVREGARKTACGHIFCSGCILRWLSMNVYCPLCKHDLTIEGGSLYVPDEGAPEEDGETTAAAAAAAVSSSLGVGEMLRTVLDGAFGSVTVSASASEEASSWVPSISVGRRPDSRRGGVRPVYIQSPPPPPDVLSEVIARTTAIMDRAKADVIAEVARAVAGLERRR